jgi:hypothetical protein
MSNGSCRRSRRKREETNLAVQSGHLGRLGRRRSKDGKSFESTPKSISSRLSARTRTHKHTATHAHTHTRTHALALFCPHCLHRSFLFQPPRPGLVLVVLRLASPRIPPTTCSTLVALRSGSCANATCKLILVLLCMSSQPPASPPMSRPRPPRRPP